jgi:hypothetical protein
MLTIHAHLPAFIAAAAIALAFIVWWIPRLQAAHSQGVTDRNRFDRENEARKTLAQIIGGVLVLAGLYSSIKTFDLQRQGARLQQEGQITDRFSKAIDQLGAVSAAGTNQSGKPNINLEVRLGGIYALERIATDSPRDHWTIMEVLMTYVRENSPASNPGAQASDSPEHQSTATHPSKFATDPPHLRTDIQAILTVISRRDTSLDPPNRQIDLSSADLSRASLKGATLENTLLMKSNLSWTDLMDASLRSADLEGASLRGASLIDTDMRGAVLKGVDLQGTDLSGADLSGAILSDDQLTGAIGDSDTKLPASVHRPASWSH